MQEILALALGSMQNDVKRLDQIGMNLANGATPGYKRGLVVQNDALPFAAALDAAATAATDTRSGRSVPVASLSMDSRAGTFKSTGHNLDVAIASDGYLEVATASGPAYTRDGSLRVDAQGRLVTALGHPVMGVAGELLLSTTNPLISPSGAVTERVGDIDRAVGQIKLMKFPEGARLDRLGEGLIGSVPGMIQLGNEEVQVRQGFIENSNVNPAHEMTQLIHTMRHFESMHRVAQSHDDLLGTAIRRLGENS